MTKDFTLEMEFGFKHFDEIKDSKTPRPSLNFTKLNKTFHQLLNERADFVIYCMTLN